MKPLIKILNFMVTIMILMCVFTGTAFAQEVGAEPEPVLSVILGHVIEVVATALALLVAWGVRKATKYFEAKTKIDIPDKMEIMIANWASKSVDYAEEKAHQFRKAKKRKMKGPDKLEAALGFGLSLAEEHGMTELAKEKLEMYIEAKLGEKRQEA